LLATFSEALISYRSPSPEVAKTLVCVP
jgi:hypothetical protein